MSDKLIDKDLLSYYDSKLKTQANILQRDTSYILGQYVYRGNIFLKCTTAGTTDTTALNLTGVAIGDILTDGTCEWIVFDPFSASIKDWQSGTKYFVGDLVINNNVLYKANTTTSTTWVDSEWDVIGTTFNTTSTYAQKIVTGVVAPYEMLMQVGNSNYCKPPIDVLKKTGGSSNTTLTLENYNNASAYTGTSDFLKIENSKAKLYNYKEYPITTQTLSTIDIGVSDKIDFSEFYGNAEPPDSNTLALLHFDNNIVDEVGNIWESSEIINYISGKFDNSVDATTSNTYLRLISGGLSSWINGDFTIDWQWKLPTGNIYRSNGEIYIITGGGSAFTFWVYQDKLYLSIQGVQSLFNIPISFSGLKDGNYHHFAIVRNSNTYSLYIDGLSVGSATDSTVFTNLVELYILGGPNISNLTGEVDEFRISNIARWTSDFTSPTGPYARPNYNISSLEVN